MDLDTYAPNKVLAPHPDPFHIYTRAELDAYEAAARHLWAIHKLFCDVPICAEQRRPQLTRHAYPGQASTRAHHGPPPCTCHYHALKLARRFQLDPYIRVPIPPQQPGYTVDEFVHVSESRAMPTYGLPGISWFDINPACPHHGHLALTHLIERMWDDPYGYGLLRDPYDLDDDERRG